MPVPAVWDLLKKRRLLLCAAGVGALCLVAVALVSCRSKYQGPEMSWARPVSELRGEPTIRVAVVQGASSMRVRVNGSCRVLVGPDGSLAASRQSVNYRIEPTSGGFRVNGEQYSGPWIEFQPQGGAQIELDGLPFPGALRIVRTDGRLMAVNNVPLERYLAGVVGNEMYPSWNPAALQAQAVAARSYALARMASRRDRTYDVYSTHISQVYAGGEVPASVADAVAETRGVVLTYQGSAAPTYYHSTCGGHTVSAGDVFGDQREAFIRGVRCSMCADAGPFAWESEFSAEDIARLVLGSPSRRVTALQAMNRGEDGRPRKIRVYTSDGHEDIDSLRFRERIGWRNLRSSRFWIETAPGGFRFVGRGFGHGVGLCQYGAQRMAELGASYPQILMYYYPELQLATVY